MPAASVANHWKKAEQPERRIVVDPTILTPLDNVFACTQENIKTIIFIRRGAVVASRFRHDLPLLSVTLLPQIAAIVGYAFYVGDFLDHYYYLSLMPAAVLTLMLGVTALRPTWSADLSGYTRPRAPRRSGSCCSRD